MSVKSILLNLNDLDNIGPMLETGCALAARHEAHLIGLYVIPSIVVYPGYYGSGLALGMAEIISTAHDKFKGEAGKVREKFEHALKLNGLQGEWRELNSLTPDIAETVIEQSRAVDLVVIAQVLQNRNCGVEDEFAEKVVIDCGRPVLVVPHGKTFTRIGQSVMIGWNRSQESTRASHDALALLGAGSVVNLVWINPQKQESVAGDVPGAELAEAFAHHGVNVTVESMVTSDMDVGEALLVWARDHEADLLVMGAYGHSRMRQMVFGGATRYVLNHMSLPVLMSC